MPADPQRNRDRLRQVNRVFCWVLPAAALAVGVDLARWSSRLNEFLPPSAPSLAQMLLPLPEVPAAGFSQRLFAQPPKAGRAPGAAPVVAQESTWKLRGVLMGPARRAFLEDESGRGVWVTDGERIGSSLVKEIRERSAVIEGAEGEYEIRM